jgi:hypothetical protein
MTVTHFPQFTNLNGYCYKTLNKENMRMRTFSRIIFVVKMCVRGNKHVSLRMFVFVNVRRGIQGPLYTVTCCGLTMYLFAQKVKSYPDMQFQAHFPNTVYVCIPKKKMTEHKIKQCSVFHY